MVERQSTSFTVSGGGFVGLLLSPWLVRAATGSKAFVMPVMAALAIGCVLGEGFGRLACISFGGCYRCSGCGDRRGFFKVSMVTGSTISFRVRGG